MFSDYYRSRSLVEDGWSFVGSEERLPELAQDPYEFPGFGPTAAEYVDEAGSGLVIESVEEQLLAAELSPYHLHPPFVQPPMRPLFDMWSQGPYTVPFPDHGSTFAEPVAVSPADLSPPLHYEYHGMLQHPVPDTPTISPLLAIQASTPVVPSQGSTSADCAQHFIDQYDSDSGTTSVRSWHKSPARATPKKRGRKPKPGTPVKPSKSLALLACEFCRKRHIKCSGALPGEGAKKRCENCIARDLKCKFPLQSFRGQRKDQSAKASTSRG